MPRICASNNDPYDFCSRHFPTFGVAVIQYGHMGDGPDGRGNCFEHDASHPDYSCDSYKCHMCGKELTDADNDAPLNPNSR